MRNLQGQATSQPGLVTHSQCYQANDHQNDDFFDSIGHSRRFERVAARPLKAPERKLLRVVVPPEARLDISVESVVRTAGLEPAQEFPPEGF